jgi:hypothetical protein
MPGSDEFNKAYNELYDYTQKARNLNEEIGIKHPTGSPTGSLDGSPTGSLDEREKRQTLRRNDKDEFVPYGHGGKRRTKKTRNSKKHKKSKTHKKRSHKKRSHKKRSHKKRSHKKRT